MPQYETANITYKGLADKGLTVQLTDENKKTWSIWKKDYKNKDEDSETYIALLGFKFGDTFGVSYVEKDESFVGKDGKTVNFKRKTIYSILPPITNPSSEYKPQAKIASPEVKYSSTNETIDWNAIAIGKTQSLFLAAYIQSGNTFGEALLQVAQARRLAEMVVAGDKPEETDNVPLPEEPNF